jgi:hypothetical protein
LFSAICPVDFNFTFSFFTTSQDDFGDLIRRSQRCTEKNKGQAQLPENWFFGSAFYVFHLLLTLYPSSRLCFTDLFSPLLLCESFVYLMFGRSGGLVYGWFSWDSGLLASWHSEVIFGIRIGQFLCVDARICNLRVRMKGLRSFLLICLLYSDLRASMCLVFFFNLSVIIGILTWNFLLFFIVV